MAARPRVFDGFLFFNELDLLEIRLNELSDVVDVFVICESPVTFTGKPKPLHYHENRARFAPWADRIVHIVADEVATVPEGASAWEREVAQRNAIARGFLAATPSDFVMFSDVDEIPSARALGRILDEVEAGRETGDAFIFIQDFFAYRLNWRADRDWTGTRMVRREVLDLIGQTLHRLRGSFKRIHRDYERLPEPLRGWMWRARLRNFAGRWFQPREVHQGGWHFTSMGDAAAIREKIAAFSHTELASPEMIGPGQLEARIAARKALRDDALTPVAISEDRFPAYLARHLDRFASMVDFDVAGMSRPRADLAAVET